MKGKTGVSNRRLLITKNSIMMLVMLVIIFLAIFAWYFINKNVSATGISVKAAQPDEVQIAVEKNGKIGSYNNNQFIEGKWTDSVIFTDANGFNFSNDVTSDGYNFIIPGFSSTEDNDDAKADARTNGKIVNLNAIPTVAKSSLYDFSQAEIDSGAKPDYYSAKFYIRSKNSNISVKPNAYVAAKVELDNEGWDMENLTSTQKTERRVSSYGDFSSDALISAMRVSLTGGAVTAFDYSNCTATDPTGASNVKCPFVWVPRPDLFLNIPTGTREDNWTLQTNVDIDTSLFRLGQDYTGRTYLHNFYSARSGSEGVDYNTAYTNLSPNPGATSELSPDPQDYVAPYTAFVSDPSKTVSLPNSSYTVPSLGVGHSITSIYQNATALTVKKDASVNNDTDSYYVYQFYLNLWIEGTDTEARRAMDTGKFSLYIEFGNSAS